MVLQKLILFSLFCFARHANAQLLIQKIPDENLIAIDAEFMQNGYQLAYSNMTSETYLFKGYEAAWKKCWVDLMHDLNNYMQKKGLKVNINTTCFNRIYFNKDGTIKAYLYQLKGLTKAQEKLFDDHLFQFLAAQKVSIKASENYWQYGTLKFE